MHNAASILVLLFLVITFVQSAYDKIFEWKFSITWLNEHFEGTFIRKMIPFSLGIIIFAEIISLILCAVGIIQLAIYNNRIFAFYGTLASCITFLILLFGQRIAKDNEGAKTIVIYFIPAVFGVYWLG
jgi:hypothetical protein